MQLAPMLSGVVRGLLLPAISGIAYGLAQPPIGWVMLVPVCLVPWLAMLPRGPSAAALSGAVAGTSAGLVMLSWVPIAASDFGFGPLAAQLPYLALATAGSIRFAAIGFLIAAAKQRTSIPAFFSVGVAFAVVESLSQFESWMIPWNFFAHAVWRCEGLVAMAALSGSALVSFCLATTNGIVASGFANARCGRTHAALPIVAVAGYGAVVFLGPDLLPANSSASSGVRVIGIQPNLPRSDRWLPRSQPTNLHILSAQTRRAIGEAGFTPDAVVWPETALTESLIEGSELTQRVERLARELSVRIVLGGVLPAESGTPHRYRNVALSVLPDEGLKVLQEKRMGVPLVEVLPEGSVGSTIERYLGEESAPWLEPGREALEVADHSVAVLLCFEVAFAQAARDRVLPETRLLLNLADDSWFNGHAVAEQQLAAAVYRAAELGLPLLRVAQSGGSAAISASGEVLQASAYGESGSIAVTFSEPLPERARIRAAVVSILVGFGIPLLLAALSHWRTLR